MHGLKGNILIIIPARGGSKGIPRKNIRSLAGKPLITYTVQSAQRSRYQPDVYVSTDDEEIRHISIVYGASSFIRDKSLAEDTTILDPVIFDAMTKAEKNENKRYDVIVTMQPTSPLMKISSVDSAIDKILEVESIDTIISAKDNTHLTWKQDSGKYVPNYMKRVNRQELTPEYMETGGFIVTRRSVMRVDSRIGPSVSLAILSDKESIDIDTFEDWNICEYYLRKKSILFVVAGNRTIGLGHVYNTLIVAGDILNHDVKFMTLLGSDLASKKIASFNYPVISQTSDDLITDILETEPDIVINDILNTSVEYVSALKDAGISVINFEDLGDGAKKAELVINAIYPEVDVIPNHYYGHEYFCVRDEFLHYPEKIILEKVERVLLTFGGVDPLDLTRKTLVAIWPYCREQGIIIDVIVGFGYHDSNWLTELDGVELRSDVMNISEYMYRADIVFTSAGRTIYEVATLCTPSIIMAQNNRELTHFYATSDNGFINLGLGSKVSNDDLLSHFVNLCENMETRCYMSALMKSQELITGRVKVHTLINKVIEEKQRDEY